METLIRELNNPINQSSPGKIVQLQREIQLHQREQSSWQLGLDFLHHHDSIIRFYGALTLTIKINADWDNDNIGRDETSREHLTKELIGSYVRLSLIPDEAFVLQKLCATLVTLFQKLESRWELPLRHLLASLNNRDGYVSLDQAISISEMLAMPETLNMRSLKPTLLLATTIAADVAPNENLDGIGLTNRVAGNCEDAFELLQACTFDLNFHANVNNTDNLINYQEREMVELTNMSIEALPFWIEVLKGQKTKNETAALTKAYQTGLSCMRVVICNLEHEEVAGTILQTLIALQQHTFHFLNDTLGDFPSQILTCPSAEKWIMSLLDGDDDPDALLYVDLLEAITGQLPLSSPTCLEMKSYKVLLKSLDRLMHCPGVAVLEDEVCQIVLEALCQIVDGYNDWHHQNIGTEFMSRFVQDICEAVLMKIQMPLQELYNSHKPWDQDERIRFQDFRYDVQDFLLSTFVSLGAGLIEAIAKTTLDISGTDDWSSFEAGIFSLTAFSDTFSSDPEDYDDVLTAVLRSSRWQKVVSLSDAPIRVCHTCIKFLADNTSYLEAHPETLIPSLNFLFKCLQHSGSASIASKAIYMLCNAQRSNLSQALPEFMYSLDHLDNIARSEKHRIYASVAAVIEALPQEAAKIEPLSFMLVRLTKRLDENMHLSPADMTIENTDLLETLAAIGKGLRAPADVPIDLERTETNDGRFWTAGPGAIIQQQALAIYRQVFASAHNSQSQLPVREACDFLKSGFPENHPSPLKFEADVVQSLLSELIAIQIPNIDSVLSCSSSFLASVKATDIGFDLNRLLYPVIHGQQQCLTALPSTSDLPEASFAASSLSFLARLVPKWGKQWLTTATSQTSLGIAMELGLVVLADPDTLPRRSAASFFAAIIDISGTGAIMDPLAVQSLQIVLDQFVPRLVAILLRLIGGESARSELEALSDPLRKLFLRQTMLVDKALREAIRDENKIMTDKALAATTIEQRTRFVAQLLRLRGAKKSNDLIKEFWVSCRGSEFGYIV